MGGKGFERVNLVAGLRIGRFAQVIKINYRDCGIAENNPAPARLELLENKISSRHNVSVRWAP